LLDYHHPIKHGFLSIRLVVWLSGNMMASINVVALCKTWLVSRWVTVYGWMGKPSQYVTSQLGQLSLSSSRGDKSSTNLPRWGEGGVFTSVGWQITLCDPTDWLYPVTSVHRP